MKTNKFKYKTTIIAIAVQKWETLYVALREGHNSIALEQNTEWNIWT
jgi:hypothetical protein